MPETFDPYRKWLGIPEQERPPNHYRLLGIELFESDADVISNAADGRMAQLKNYQAGKYSAYSQRLLNEIATAKVCLLHPAKKTEYDRQLKKTGVQQEEKSKNAEASGEEMTEIAGITDFASTRTSAYAHHAGRRRSRWFVPLLLTGGAVLFIAFLAFWTREDAKNAVAKQPQPVPAPSQPVVPAAVKPEPAKPAPTPEKPTATEKKKPEKPAKQPEPAQLTVEKPTPPAEEPAAESPAEKPAEPAAEPEAEKKPKKLPVPEEAKQQAAEAKIREVFGGEFTAAKTAEQKIGLASKLAKQAAETTDDADARFVLYRMACNLAAEAGELSEAFRTVDTMAEDYELNPLNVKTALLAKAVEGNRFAGKADGHANALISAATALLEEATAADNFEAAGRILKLATTAVRASKDPQMIRDMAARAREMERLKAKFAAVKKAMDTLVDNPRDADACLAVGQWYCFIKGDWENGLPLLQKGSNDELAKSAGQDIAHPKDPKKQLALADAWWDLGESEQGQAKSSLHARAAHWYEAVMPLLTGLEKAKAKKRLESLTIVADAEEKAPAGVAKARGVIQRGNVALASNGAKVSGTIKQPECLIDGVTTCSYKRFEGTAWNNWPCEWIITLDKVYRLQEIRFRLWDGDKRFCNYAIAVSADGKNFTPLVDRSQGQWASWQQIQFSPRPVKAIKLLGLRSSTNQYFSVIEFEAYCLSPERAGK